MPTSNFVDPFDNPGFDPQAPQPRPAQQAQPAQGGFVDPFDDPTFRLIPPVKPVEAPEGTFGPEGMALFQGLTFGFGDEIIGGVRSTFGSTPYDEAVDQERKAYQQYTDAHPWKAMGWEMAGGAPWALLSGGASAAGSVARGAKTVYQGGKNLFRTGGKAVDEATELFGGPPIKALEDGVTTLGQRVAGGILGASAEGALSGAGNADGDLKDRLKGAGVGATVGATVGAAMPLVAQGARGATRVFEDATGIAPGKTAERKILQQFERDRTRPEYVQGDMEVARADGVKPEIIADYLPGGNVSGLTEALGQKMGPTKQAARDLMDARADGQSERVLGDLRSVFGDRMNYFDKFDQLVADRAKAAKTDYEKAYGVGEVKDDDINKILRRLPREVFDRTKEHLRLEGKRMPQAFRTDEAGNSVPNEKFVPTVEYIDHVKRGIDSVIEAETDALGKVSSRGRDYVRIKDSLLGRLDELVPDYAAARKNFRDPSQMLDAMKLGQDIFKERAEKTARTIADMNDNEKEAYIIGVSDALVKRVDDVSTGRDVTQALWKNDTQKKQIREAIAAVEPDEDKAEVLFDSLERMMQREREMAATRNRIHSGSQTAPRTDAINDFNRIIPAGVAELASGGTGAGAAVNAVGSLFKRGGLLSRHDAINDEAGQMLYASTPEAQEAVFKRLTGRQEKMDTNAFRFGLLGDTVSNLAAQEAGRDAGAYIDGRPVRGLLNVPAKRY